MYIVVFVVKDSRGDKLEVDARLAEFTPDVLESVASSLIPGGREEAYVYKCTLRYGVVCMCGMSLRSQPGHGVVPDYSLTARISDKIDQAVAALQKAMADKDRERMAKPEGGNSLDKVAAQLEAEVSAFEQEAYGQSPQQKAEDDGLRAKIADQWTGYDRPTRPDH